MTPFLLILGANGQLGRHFVRILTERGLPHLATDLPATDVTDPATLRKAGQEARRLAADRPLAVINCAAYTDVERAESERDLCRRVNAEGAANAADLAESLGAFLVHFSTDYVFDGGRRTPYVESDPTNPLNHYGRTKLEGEDEVRRRCPRHAILRISWLFGPYGRNFVGKILELGRSRPALKVVDDQTGSPTYTGDVVAQTLALLDSGATGLFHASNLGAVTWREFAEAVVRQTGLPCRIVPCTSAEYPQKALRPSYSVLENRRLKDLGLLRMRPWTDALKDHLDILAQGAAR